MKRILLLSLLAGILLCHCKKGPEGKKSLIDLITEGAGANCPNGGYKIITGIDLNDNDLLDAGEIQHTKYICNGLNGSSPLLTMAVEPAGPNCTTGGYKMSSGSDINNNGTLEQNEIKSAQYICNGMYGSNSLIAVVTEPAGTNCTTGGYKMSLGVDSNNNGTLEADEVKSLQYICNGLNGSNSLFAVVAEPAGANCTRGGYKLHSGIDLNNNNILDAAEIRSTQYICNGQNGNSSMVSITAEPAGANCTAGGYKMGSGIDVNNNGILEESEIKSSQYICNGLYGSNSLISLMAEPAGVNCTSGGYKINSGVDLNNNGTLDAAEIKSVQYICNQAVPVNPVAFARQEQDVAYGTDASQQMDIYLPAGRSGQTTKVLVMLHGGAWTEGDKSNLYSYIDTCRRRFPDYAIFNINYRLTSLFPAQENDVKAAIEFINSKRSDYGISDKFVLLGVSAGAHLALLQGYKYTSPVKVKAVIDFFGPADITDMYNNPASADVPQVTPSNISRLLGGTPATNAAMYSQSSPINFVTAQSPPTMLLHGGQDNVVRVSQAVSLRDKLAANHVVYEYVFYPGESHGWTDANLSDSFKKIQAFLSANVQ